MMGFGNQLCNRTGSGRRDFSRTGQGLMDGVIFYQEKKTFLEGSEDL